MPPDAASDRSHDASPGERAAGARLGRRLVAASRIEALGWAVPDDAALSRCLERGAALMEVALAPDSSLTRRDGGPGLAHARALHDVGRLLRIAGAWSVPLLLTDCDGRLTDDELAHVAEHVRRAARREGIRCRVVLADAERDLAPSQAGVVVAGGRCAGAAVAAAGIAAGADPAPAWHMASILAAPAGLSGGWSEILPAAAGGGMLIGTLDDAGFTIEPADPRDARHAAAFVAVSLLTGSAHRRRVPGGELLLAGAHVEPLSGGRVRVTGSRFADASRADEMHGGPANLETAALAAWSRSHRDLRESGLDGCAGPKRSGVRSR